MSHARTLSRRVSPDGKLHQDHLFHSLAREPRAPRNHSAGLVIWWQDARERLPMRRLQRMAPDLKTGSWKGKEVATPFFVKVSPASQRDPARLAPPCDPHGQRTIRMRTDGMPG